MELSLGSSSSSNSSSSPKKHLPRCKQQDRNSVLSEFLSALSPLHLSRQCTEIHCPRCVL
jgi:hypothetical protein